MNSSSHSSFGPTSSTNLAAELQWRGLVSQTSDPKVLSEYLSQDHNKALTLYCGFDPTADSLHVGHLLPIVMLKRFQQSGHRPIAVVGGATGMIGDPSGKSQERNLLDEIQLQKNVAAIKVQLSRFIRFADDNRGTSNNSSATNDAILANNADWFAGVSYIQFLRDVGKHFSVNMMLGKESVRARLEDRDHGISYTEFSYMLLQSYDFLKLFEQFGCTLQIGGSDQWGNIVAGIDLIRRTKQGEAYGLTIPLVTKSDGTKFGKSEKGSVWLDAERTSPYEFYQFFLQVADADAVIYLKYFTFLNKERIDELEALTKSKPEDRAAQKALAEEVTKMVHGSEALQQAQAATSALFSNNLEDLSNVDEKTLEQMFKEAPRTAITHAQLCGAGLSLIDALVTTALCASKGAARKDITGGGIYVNQERMADANFTLGAQHLLANRYIVLRKGKKTYHLLVVG